MITRVPKYSMEEHARMANELYEKLRPTIEPGNHGKIVSIDVDTGEYELGEDSLSPALRLLERLPDAQIWTFRIGYPYVHRI